MNTDQQAVPVAQFDAGAKALFDDTMAGRFAAPSARPSWRDVDEEEKAGWRGTVAAVIEAERLASLPCKSGEGAGEREALSRFHEGSFRAGFDWACGPDGIAKGPIDAEVSRRAALATQPVSPDLIDIAQKVLDRGYISNCIEEERDDHNELVAALAAAQTPSIEATLKQVIAQIIDPHSFCDVPFTDEPVLLDMVEQSKGDALRKADRILALTPDATQMREAELLGWLGQHRNLELTHYSPYMGDEDDQSVEWRVTRQSGHYNDREWAVIGRGETPADAIDAARATLKARDAA